MLHKKGKFKRGVFKPQKTKKYVGQSHPEYRSSWELHFFQWCDRNPYVLEWAAEAVVVPYTSPIDNKVHRYYIDVVLILKERKGNVKYLVEIKPYKQTIPPKVTKNKKESSLLHEQATFQVNQAKWHAAQKWADDNGYKFMLITERELFSGKK